ncbi:MAG TPA: LAGLIDADG family homing endonuclease [Candidatus Nanoarchaeia archaeon]|nr:LAGLIDADG family homing endonuclease [Candidatus Nanoarchaeia archaeon]
MTRGERLALFLGMLSGDGCLSISHNGEGYRDYPIQFYNNDKEKVLIFSQLFFELFGIIGRVSSRTRKNRKEIWEFVKKSRKIADYLKGLGFPEGVKRDVLRVLPIIKNGTFEEKLQFLHGFIITDGYTTKDILRFHLGSKLFLEDLALLISEFIGVVKPIKAFSQNQGKYKSYQLYLNKQEKDLILGRRATMVLGQS